VTKYRVSPTVAEEKALSAAGGWGGTSVMTLFGAQKSACALGGRWWLCRLREKDYASLRLGAAEAPYGTVHTFVGYGKATLINKNSPNREAALKFIEYLHSEPYNTLINHQADGIGPVMKYADGEKFLHDPAYPNEDYNHVWREMQKAAVAEQVSPFMNGSVLQRLMGNQLDQVKNGDKSASAAMQDAAREVNAIIQDNVRRVPALREKYEALRAKQQVSVGGSETSCHSDGSGSDPRNLGVATRASCKIPQVASAPFGMTVAAGVATAALRTTVAAGVATAGQAQ
jgi:hypothetical protein